MFRKGAKRASITTEVSFAILATLAVLFLVLGMFQDNIKQFIDKGGFSNTWNNTAAKTAEDKWNIDPTKNQIKTNPEDQTTSWDAILQNYNDKAQQKIQTYYETYVANGSTDTSLTDSQKIDLAMWMSIYANSVTSNTSTAGGLVALANKTIGNTTYLDFASTQSIDFTRLNKYQVKITNLETSDVNINWGTSSAAYSDEGRQVGGSAKMRVANIREQGGIVNAFQNHS